MEDDEDAHKGTAVTKPIDLRVKKAGGSIRGGGKSHCADPKEDPTAKGERAAPISALGTARGRKTAPKPEIIDQIALRLRGVYNDVLMQPVPARFMDLLSQLEAGIPAEMEEGARSTGSKKGAK
jgi:Anti-sigma factor NepR